MEDLNYGATVPALMSVALGMVDGFVVAGSKPWDLWASRAIFNALKIPYAFLEPFTYRNLRPEEIVPDSEKEYAFACANNPALFEQIMQILQNCRTIRFPRESKLVGSEWPGI
jgi:fructose-1,6-bisphosphatase/inositol monophosphatase family enzyme